MPPNRKFSDLRDRARRDPARARRIDESRNLVLQEQAKYRIAELRRALGLTQAELAHRVGKSQSAVSQIETGEIGVSIEILRAIVAQLGGELEITAVFQDRRILLDP